MGKIANIEVDDILISSGLRPTARSAGVPLFDSKSSELLFIICEHIGVGVLGIEGFTIVAGGRRPEMDYIADFSNLLSGDNFVIESIKMARKFLQLASKKQLLFEYVLAEIDGFEDTTAIS
jgi:hypothetical protein